MSFGDALAAECSRIRRNPTDTLGTVAFNAVLMIAAWMLVPRNLLFTWTGPSGFALALEGWMYADVTASNVLAPDSRRALAAMNTRRDFLRLLTAKAVALWMLIAPLCATVAVVVGFYDGRWLFTVCVVVAVALCPFGALAGTALVGIVFPYHQRSLQWRWQQRRHVGGLVRWGALLVIPYVVFPMFSALTAAVPLMIWRIGVSDGSRIETADFAVCVVVAIAISAGLWWASRRVAVWWIERHGVSLRAYLNDPDRG
nr:hypothetical protein [Rhodococcus sp. (in: high G+C Gram-positive bacteria)]